MPDVAEIEKQAAADERVIGRLTEAIEQGDEDAADLVARRANRIR